MKKKISLTLILALGMLQGFTEEKPKDKRPNILLILADDLGYSDLGAYGGEIQTPNLDRLAKQGLRLQEFYNNSICAPTRASLLTGQYQHKAGVGYFSNDLGIPAYQGYLNKESLTLAEVLKESGYTTLTSGKWHVSNQTTSLPWQRGFDQVYPRDVESAGSGAPKEKTRVTDQRGYPIPEFFQTNVITKNAVSFLDEAHKKDNPFFLYLAYTAPHWPLVALPEDIAKYKGKYDLGWDQLRKDRFERQKALGIVKAEAKISVKDDDIYDWARLSYDQKKQWAKKMEVFAAMVDRLDQGVGEVFKKLEETGQADNTIIIFISDNGAPAEDLVKWYHGAVKNEGPVGTEGSFESQSKNWSYLSNTPFLGFKDDMHEGGINSPFIAWYPSKIKAGGIKQGTGHIIDLAPTFYELANAKYPKKYKETNTNPLPGKSLLPLLFGESSVVARNEPLFWERAGNRAVREGKWKLVSTYPSYAWELYNLELDQGETTDVSARNHELVSQLSEKYFAWAKKTGVVEFSTLEDREPKMMKEFRKSKSQERVVPGLNRF